MICCCGVVALTACRGATIWLIMFGHPRGHDTARREQSSPVMCGSCANEPMVSFHPGDVLRYRAATGAPPRIGKVEELDPIWGVSVLWESGERSWFAYESWCPLQV